MAEATCTTLLALVTGARATSSTHIRSFNTAGTAVISCDDLDKMIIFGINVSSTASLALTMGVGTEYSSIGIGTKTWTIGTANASILGLSCEVSIWGGAGADSSRYKTTAETLVVTIPAGGVGYIGAFRLP